MRKVERILLPLVGSLLLLSACGRSPSLMSSPYLRGYRSAQQVPQQSAVARQSQLRAEPLVAVEGVATGDNLKVKGPMFTSGKGKVLNLSPDAFKIQFQIVNHHLIVDATRIDAQKVRFVTVDVNSGKTAEAIGVYRREGKNTVFDMGPGGEVEKLTVRPIKPGNFETDVVQPGRLFLADSRGSNTLKFFKE